ncbi:hypothetical protein [Amycolatopsis arida]|uniref:hypothetical protein n=1 Tax=Amycolatopsis arida TaxID=587909 RepID=UPI0010670466|nr:hypothetical protein [Amycolatopsis arida]TDX84949.1 hypothetical protein CLV69_11733 [Amycolatopsis arida]
MQHASGGGSTEPPSATTDHAAVSAVDDYQQFGIEGPDYWTFAQVKDWILLCPDIPHTAVRVYGVFRSLATRFLNDRRLSKDQIRYLVPGVNDKPMSKTAFDDALRVLVELKLIEVLRTTSVTRTERNTATGKFERVEHLLFRVNELPHEGRDYQGPHTIKDKLDTYPGPGWDTEPKRQNTRSNRARKSGHGSTSASPTKHRDRKSGTGLARPDQAKRDVPAGRTGRTSNRKSGNPGRNSGRVDALTSANPAPHTYLPNPDTDTPSVRLPSHHSARANETTDSDGRTDRSTTTQMPETSAEAVAIVDTPEIRADLERVDLRPSQRSKLIAAVDRLLLRFPEPQVQHYVAIKAREARTVKFLLSGLTDYADDAKTAALRASTATGPVVEAITGKSAPNKTADQRPLWPSAVSAKSAAASRPAPRPRQEPPSDLLARGLKPKYLPTRLRDQSEAS